MLVFGFGVQVEATVQTGFVRINDGLPCAIQADSGAVGNVVDRCPRARGCVAEDVNVSDRKSRRVIGSLASPEILVRAGKGVKPRRTLS